jgi:hypothetical protein
VAVGGVWQWWRQCGCGWGVDGSGSVVVDECGSVAVDGVWMAVAGGSVAGW